MSSIRETAERIANSDEYHLREFHELGPFVLVVREATAEGAERCAVPWEILLTRGETVLPIGSGITREHAVEYAAATLVAVHDAIRKDD